jgi:hypothetical protein
MMYHYYLVAQFFFSGEKRFRQKRGQVSLPPMAQKNVLFVPVCAGLCRFVPQSRFFFSQHSLTPKLLHCLL